MTSVDGTLAISGEIALIGFERRLRHPVDAVWAALTDPEQLSGWLGQGTVEPREGGNVSIRTGCGNPASVLRPINSVNAVGVSQCFELMSIGNRIDINA